MAVLPILIHPDPRLKKVCDPVTDITDEVRQLASNMLETMYHAPGIGLAAPQVGIMHRLLVADAVKEGQGEPRPLVMINPEVVAQSDERSVYDEGCLSIPEQYAEVERPAEVTLQWVDENGTEHREDFSGLWATCLQHEVDHLNGILFIDYLKPLKRQLITRRMQKLKRERARA